MRKTSVGEDDIRCLLGDALGVSSLPLNNPHESDSRLEGNINESNEEHAQSSKDKDIPYERLLKECDKELYPGCKYSNLSFTLHLYHVKCMGDISNKCFSMLLELFRDAFPHLTSLPSSANEAKKLTTDLGLGYKKIHACPKDCMLYWGLPYEGCLSPLTLVMQDILHIEILAKWLEENHNYRLQKDRFDGTCEEEGPPAQLTGSDILKQVSGGRFKYVKLDNSSKKRTRDGTCCSIDTNLHTMEATNEGSTFEDIENDIEEYIDGENQLWKKKTLLNLNGKTKDNENNRKDLMEMGIRHELHLKNHPNKKAGVSLKDSKIMNLKSHDGHILMQDILMIALRASMFSRSQTRVMKVTSDLCLFFKGLCNKVLDMRELDKMEHDVVQTLCELEQLFPPSFFTIMVHLTVHLILEAKLGGPVHYRWMYPVERYLMQLKSYVRNKAQPKGSIAEAYIKDECLTFCSRYFEGVETPFNRPPRNDESIVGKEMYMLNSSGRKLGKLEIIELDWNSLNQAHHYVSFLEKNKFDKEVLSLAIGPKVIAKQFNGFITNGYRFLTKKREKLKKTQNSGVIVAVEGGYYYGKLTNIIELDYSCGYKVVLFQCDWVDIRPSRGLKKDKYGFPLVNFSRPLVHTGEKWSDDPFIISSQAKQVFYIDDIRDVGWSHVIQTKPRDIYDMGSDENKDEFESYTQCMPCVIPILDDVNEAPSWHRTNIEIDSDDERFMTLLLKESKLCPPDFKDWTECKTGCGVRLLLELRLRFSLPERKSVDNVIFEIMDDKFRTLKYKLKMKLFGLATNRLNELNEDGEQEMDYTEDELLQALNLIEAPKYFMDHQWQMHKIHLRTPATKKMSLNGKRARGGQVHIHTTDAHSFAWKRDEQ
ncbi:zinc finger, CCHC-type containing protein, partial [Tanacetum coccineum]